MLAFRALANMFYTKTGKATMKDEAEEIIDTLKRRGFVGVSKNGKIALSTVVLKYVFRLVSERETDDSAQLFGDCCTEEPGCVCWTRTV
jgi:hypothetical protein